MQPLEKTLASLFKLARKKYLIDQKRGEAKYFDIEWLLNEIIDEVEEVRAEIQDNNSVYLEDELGDILWGLVVVAVRLEKMGKISQAEAFLPRALQKYQERTLPLQGEPSDDILWDKVKKEQKIRLKEENQKRHNNNG